MDQPETGILVFAFGAERYKNMASRLADSLDLYAPEIPRTLVTDDFDDPSAKRYTSCVELDLSLLGGPMSQTLHINHYSPYEKTLVIDADCLVYRPLDDMLARLDGHSLTVIGGPVTDGYWYTDIAELCKRLNVSSIPKFNGGLIYCERETSASIFAKALEIVPKYDELGLERFRGKHVSDEAVIAVAMAVDELPTVSDDGSIMCSLIDFHGYPRLNVLRGKSRFKKGDRWVEPAIVHYVGGHADLDALHGAFYRTEVDRILRHRERGQSVRRASFAALLRGLPRQIYWAARTRYRRTFK